MSPQRAHFESPESSFWVRILDQLRCNRSSTRASTLLSTQPNATLPRRNESCLLGSSTGRASVAYISGGFLRGDGGVATSLTRLAEINAIDDFINKCKCSKFPNSLHRHIIKCKCSDFRKCPPLCLCVAYKHECPPLCLCLAHTALNFFIFFLLVCVHIPACRRYSGSSRCLA